VPTLAANLRLPDLSIIAEIKRRSPSAGEIADLPDVSIQASQYLHGGATAISVLTEETHFGGSIQDLAAVTSMATVPVLRKDFVIDARQIDESARLGASVILLIAAILSPQQAWEFHCQALELGLETIF